MSNRIVARLTCLLALVLVVLVPLAACGPAATPVSPAAVLPTISATENTATPPVGIHPTSGTPPMTPANSLSPSITESVTFTTADGIELAGTLFGEGDIAVILAHQGTYGADQKTWHPFARLLAERGYTALAFDFRGVGQSGGQLHYRNLAMDVSAAVQFLQDRGYKKIVCIGASMGGTACIRAARDYPFVGLIILASTMTAGSGADSLRLAPDDLEGLAPPKLFICAEYEYSVVVGDTRRMYELSPDPKNLLLLPGARHGTDLFNTDAGEELKSAMLGFLENTANPTLDVLPALQPIHVENADKIVLLRTMTIPDYSIDQISQCSVAFSPDNRFLVGACGKSQVPVWDVQTGSLVHTLYDAPVHIVACAFSPDGKQIACGGFDKAVTLWDAITGSKSGSFEGHTAPVWDIAFDPAGKSLVSCSLGLFGGGSGRGAVRLWKILDAQPLWIYSGTRDYLSLSFHPAGKTIAYGSIGGRVGILDAESGELQLELTDSSSNIGGVAYSSSGHWLAAGSDDDRIYLWDATDYKLAARLSGHEGYVNGVAFSPDETLLASGSHDKTVGVWNLAERESIVLLKGHEHEVLRVAFNPDGTLIASISWDGTVRLWGIPR